MKKIIIALAIYTLLGAGCGGEVTSPPPCTSEPTESDIGTLMYPADSKYEKLGYLGQIFTALDCGDPERAKKVFGFEDNEYVAGVTLVWKKDGPSAEARAVLSKLGFAETQAGIWTIDGSLTLQALEELRQLFQNPDELNNLQYADCIKCG